MRWLLMAVLAGALWSLPVLAQNEPTVSPVPAATEDVAVTLEEHGLLGTALWENDDGTIRALVLDPRGWVYWRQKANDEVPVTTLPLLEGSNEFSLFEDKEYRMDMELRVGLELGAVIFDPAQKEAVDAVGVIGPSLGGVDELFRAVDAVPLIGEFLGPMFNWIADHSNGWIGYVYSFTVEFENGLPSGIRKDDHGPMAGLTLKIPSPE